MNEECMEYLKEAFGEKGLPTLRDFFAGCALAGYTSTDHDCNWHELAHDAFKQADAMIVVRNTP